MKLSKNLEKMFTNNDTITFGEFLQHTKHKSYGFLLLLLALPAALPIPAPGYATPFGIILVLIGLQIIVKRNTPWFPSWALEKTLPVTKGSKLLKSMIKFLELFEVFLKPRLKFLTRGVGYRMLGLIVAVCGASMIIPLPLTNTVPSFSIFLIGLSFLEEDGLFALGGFLSSLIGLTISGTMLYFLFRFGTEGIRMGEELIRSII